MTIFNSILYVYQRVTMLKNMKMEGLSHVLWNIKMFEITNQLHVCLSYLKVDK